MATPTFVDCTKDVWTKVATNVTTGTIWFVSHEPNVYLHTYISPTGAAAPAVNSALGVAAPNSSLDGSTPAIQIAAAAGIDVYIMPLNEDGRVRVDV